MPTDSVRLTVAQAIVTYLSRQYSVADGQRRRLIPAALGIFGHGNMAGLGQTLDQLSDALPFIQGRNEHPIEADTSANDAFRPLARFFDRITRPERLLTALPQARRALTDPVDTGAVVLALPQDIQSHAHDHPVAETFAGKGAVQQRAWWQLGGIGLEGTPATNDLAREGDLVLTVGARLTDFATASQSLFQHPRSASPASTSTPTTRGGSAPPGSWPTPNVPWPGLSSAPAPPAPPPGRSGPGPATASGRPSGRPPSIPTRPSTSRRRAPSNGPTPGPRSPRARSSGCSRSTPSPATSSSPPPTAPPATSRRSGTPPRAASPTWSSGSPAWAMSCRQPSECAWPNPAPPGGSSRSWADGTFLMAPTELVTAAQEGLAVTVVVPEDRGYQVIHRLQMLRSGRELGNEFRHRDGSLELTGSAEGAGVWWDVAPAEVAEQEAVARLRAEYEDGLATRRWHG